MGSESITVNSKTCDFQDFGDEIVVIDGRSGVFYSLKGRAMAVWRTCLNVANLTELRHQIGDLDGDEASLLDGMLDDLLRDEILVPGEKCDHSDAPLDWQDLAVARFERNEDLDDLIKLDPIHDVTDEGWPHRDNSTAS